MTVKELIKELQKLDKNEKVYFELKDKSILPINSIKNARSFGKDNKIVEITIISNNTL